MICFQVETNNSFHNIPDVSLESERLHHEGKLRRRKQILYSIISNRPIKIEWFRGLLYAPCIIIAGFLSTVPLSLFPAHDLLQYPEYWYEHIFHGILSTTSGWILQCFRASYFLNISLREKN